MTPQEQGSQTFWSGFLVLLLVGILLGIRAGNAVQAVLEFQGGAPAPAKTAIPPDNTSAAAMAHRDSLIAGAHAGLRDPFHSLAAPRIYRPAPPDTARAQATPTLKAMFFDPASPMVKLSLGTSNSGWLHPGDTFAGWSVVEIQPKTVWISRNGNNVYLSSH